METRLKELPAYRMEGCVRLNTRPLQLSIANHARNWILALGDRLRLSTKQLSKEYIAKVSVISYDINIYCHHQNAKIFE